MATLFVRTRTADDGSKRYSVVYRRGGRYFPTEHAGTFKTQREALIRKQAVAEILAAGLNPKVELAKRLTPGRQLQAVAEEWLASRRGLAEGTRAGHRFRLPVLTDAFDRVDEITVEEVNDWVSRLAADYQPGTVRLFVQQLRMILDFADLPTNPARSKRIELPRERRKTISPPTAQQVVAVAANLPRDLLLPVLLMEQLGTRVSETMMIEKRDVDAVRGAVRIKQENAKTGRARMIPASELLVDALLERLPFSGTRNRANAALRHVNASFSPHDLRHRRASLWSAQNVPAAQAAEWLGHTVATYHARYTHVIVDEEISDAHLRELLR